MISDDWGAIINNCDIVSWKEALAAALTHASEEDLPILCGKMFYKISAIEFFSPKIVNQLLVNATFILAGLL